MPSTGYLIDHPLAVASRTNPRRWDMRLLMAGQPAKAVPAHYIDPMLRRYALNQNPVGACVMFSAQSAMNAQEGRDEGRDLFASGTWNGENSTACFRSYWELKNGYGSFPGDGIPGVEGSYPEAAMKLGVAEGFVDAAGKRHKLSAYYSHDFGSLADFEFVQQVILTFGPVVLGIPWANAWFPGPPAPLYRLPPFDGASSAHAIALAGWDLWGDGSIDVVFQQTWGSSWTNQQGIYRMPVEWLFRSPLGPQIVWKMVDMKDAPAPPPPSPEGPMLTLLDKTQRMVDSHLGAQLYRVDGSPLVTIGSGPANLASPCQFAEGYYGVLARVGGVLQLAALKLADCTNVRVMGDTGAATAAEKKRWLDWIGTAPK